MKHSQTMDRDIHRQSHWLMFGYFLSFVAQAEKNSQNAYLIFYAHTNQ